jgi:ABC-type transporter Mla maintaining outer membrane lipid asymmetry ATPase subunit MlaF
LLIETSGVLTSDRDRPIRLQSLPDVSSHDAGGHSERPVVVLDHVSLAFDDRVVLRDISFSVRPGHMTILLGASGAGKSVVLKLILGLLKPDAGTIRVNGERIDTMSEAQMMKVRDDIGMLFQESALFDSLTVADNVGYKLYEETDMPADQVRRVSWRCSSAPLIDLPRPAPQTATVSSSPSARS